MRVINRTQGTVVADQAEAARSFSSRLVGLLGRSELAEGEGLWIQPCNSIHTWFMRFPIDAIFFDKTGKVLRVYEHLKPWRMTRIVIGAKGVLELPAGAARGVGVSRNDQLVIEE